VKEDFAVQVRLYNNQLKERRHELQLTQKEIAKAAGVTLQMYAAYENFGYTKHNLAPPWDPRIGTWSPTARKIANFHCVDPEVLFTVGILKVQKGLSELKLDKYAAESLLSTALQKGASSPEHLLEEKQQEAGLSRNLALAIKQLSPLEQKVLHVRHKQRKTLQEAEAYVGVSREQVHQIEARALRKLRHSDLAVFTKRFYLGDRRNGKGVERVEAALNKFGYDQDLQYLEQQLTPWAINDQIYGPLANNVLITMHPKGAAKAYTLIKSSDLTHTRALHAQMRLANNYAELRKHLKGA